MALNTTLQARKPNACTIANDMWREGMAYSRHMHAHSAKNHRLRVLKSGGIFVVMRANLCVDNRTRVTGAENVCGRLYTDTDTHTHLQGICTKQMQNMNILRDDRLLLLPILYNGCLGYTMNNVWQQISLRCLNVLLHHVLFSLAVPFSFRSQVQSSNEWMNKPGNPRKK